MITYLDENVVQQVLNMDILLQTTEQSLKDRALHKAIDIPRQRIYTPEGTQHVLQASSKAIGYTGFKYYYTAGSGRKSFYIHLLNMKTGLLEAIVEAVWLGMIRTGAASGVAAKALANPGASVLAQMEVYQEDMRHTVEAKAAKLEAGGYRKYLADMKAAK